MTKQPDWCIGQLETHNVTASKFQYMRKLAPVTDSCNRFAPGACSLISNQFDMREQNTGAKRFVSQHIFSLEIVGADEGALLRERVAGTFCGSKPPLVYRT